MESELRENLTQCLVPGYLIYANEVLQCSDRRPIFESRNCHPNAVNFNL